MANNRINRYIGAIALGTVLTVVPGCTDTWDDHYNNEPASGATLTLWDLIKDNPDYSRFADIVRHAKYYKDNTHAVPTYTYADILSGGQVNTLWVPDNDVLSEEEYQKWLQMCESESAMDGYNVQQQFLGNHIALWRHNISNPGVDTVKMINGKNLEFDKTNLTLEGLPLGDKYNIPAVNGVMHVLKGIAPFHYNFYESLKYTEPQTLFGKYVVGKDTTYFSADRSIEGLPDENGNPTYVDSVYRTSNRLFETTKYLPDQGSEKWQMYEQGFGARIDNEDSVFVMIMPTDQAWTAAYEMLKPSHTYASYYENKVKGDLNSSETVKDLKPDSLQKMSIEMDLVSPLVFNIHKQPKINGEINWTLDEFKTDGGARAEYLLNTYGDTLRTIEGVWDKASLFEGEPIEMSNGLAYEVPSWNFPSQYYTPDVDVEIEGAGVFYNPESNYYKIGPSSARYSFSNDAYKDITDKYGRVSNNNFFHLDASGPTAGPKLEIKLLGNNPNAYVPNAQVMSGKYDIQLVVVPHWYLDIVSAGKIEDEFYKMDTLVNELDITDTTFVRNKDIIDTAYVKKLADSNKYKIKAALTYNDGKKNKDIVRETLISSIDYDGLRVDTLTLKSDFEFPVSYKNMRFSYPVLYLEGVTAKKDALPQKDINKAPYGLWVFDLLVDKIILKRKD